MSLKIGQNVYWQRINEQVYILWQGKFVLLNKTGSLVWLGFFRQQDMHSIVKSISDLFDVDAAIVWEDVNDIIISLTKIGVLVHG